MYNYIIEFKTNSASICYQEFKAIENFHVTSYQANFANHPTHYPLQRDNIEPNNKMIRYLLFGSYHFKITTEWQEFPHTHSDEISNPVMK